MAISDGTTRTTRGLLPQVALFLGENAATADKAALARAKALDAQGLDPWAEGWFRDQTGWSFETDDRQFKELNTLMPGVRDRTITRSYPQQYHHPDLERAYPEALPKSRVTLDPAFAKREDADGMVTEGNRLWLDTALPPDQRLSTGLHETQHMLDNTEGRRRFPGRDYMADPREQRAFNVEFRRTWTPEQRRAVSPSKSLPDALRAYLETDGDKPKMDNQAMGLLAQPPAASPQSSGLLGGTAAPSGGGQIRQVMMQLLQSPVTPETTKVAQTILAQASSDPQFSTDDMLMGLEKLAKKFGGSQPVVGQPGLMR